MRNSAGEYIVSRGTRVTGRHRRVTGWLEDRFFVRVPLHQKKVPRGAARSLVTGMVVLQLE